MADWPTRDAMDVAYLTGQRPADVLRMRLPDIRDGYLWLTQGKTSTKLRMAIAGELAALIERIQSRTYKVTSLSLIRNETGQPLSYYALDNRFEEARKRAAMALEHAGEGEAAAAVKRFQFRDLRAKAGTDKADATDLRGALQQLGHKSVKTTEIYLRARAGEKVTPTR
ncbi:MAG: tyrosine-type recombinase/integrase [Casimicrobiaceae bacterium]